MLKNALIYIRYFIIRYLINKKFRSSYLHLEAEIVCVNKQKKLSTFYGYYNISPFNLKNYYLFGSTADENERSSQNSNLNINVSKPEEELLIIANTRAWNWQQGAMLQWYSESKIIFNDFDSAKEKYISKIIDTESGDSRVLSKPIYSLSNDGTFALSLNFERLAVMRPDYGYFNKTISSVNLPPDDKDGVWRLNILSDSSNLILSLDALKHFEPNQTMEGAEHKVNHIDISPNGKRFMFLHRWVGPQGRFTRLLTANCVDGSDLHLVTGNVMVSHNCWYGNEGIISYCRLQDGTAGYVHFIDKSGFSKVIGKNILRRDGHPSISPDGRWMLTDEYPNLNRFSKLYLYDLVYDKNYCVGEFYQPLKYRGEMRVDLHPKWAPDGRRISIDSAHSGKRQMYIIDLNNFFNAI